MLNAYDTFHNILKDFKRFRLNKFAWNRQLCDLLNYEQCRRPFERRIRQTLTSHREYIYIPFVST